MRQLLDIAGAPGGPEPRQLAVYHAYQQLQSIAEKQYSGSLAGRLLLCTGFDQRGAELALAATIAGGAFLGVEPDAQRLKAAGREGACDFMVNTLDEALRVLKNELRKRTPLSAGLLGSAEELLPAMAERGVQPDLLAVTSGMDSATKECREALEKIVERGADLFPAPGAEVLENDSSDEVLWTAANLQDLHRMDRIALELLPPGDLFRRRWLDQAAGYFYRRKPLARVLDLSPEERARLCDAFRQENGRTAFQTPALVRWRSSDGAEQMVSLH